MTDLLSSYLGTGSGGGSSSLLSSYIGDQHKHKHSAAYRAAISSSGSSSASGGGGHSLLGGFIDAITPDPVSEAVSWTAHGAANLAEGVGQGLYNMGRAGVLDVKNHPAGLLTGPGAFITSPLISAGEGGGGGHTYHDVLKPIGVGYYSKYGPIFRHPWSLKSYQVAYHDPVGTFLDIASIAAAPFSGGTSAAIRGVGLTERVGAAARFVKYADEVRAGRQLEYVNDAGQVHKAVDKFDRPILVGGTQNPLLRRPFQRAYDAVSSRLPGQVVVKGKAIPIPVSMAGRVGRIEDAANAQIARSMELAAAPFRKALGKISEDERLALPFIALGVDRPSMLRMLDETHGAAKDTLEAARQELVHAHMQQLIEHGGLDETAAKAEAEAAVPPTEYHPTTATMRLVHMFEERGAAIDKITETAGSNEKLMKAVNEGRKLAKKQLEIFTSAERFTHEAGALRVERPARFTAGSRKLTAEEMKSEDVSALQKELSDARQALNKAQNEVDDPDLAMEAADEKWTRALERADELGLEVTDEGKLTGWTQHDPAQMEANARLIDPAAGPKFYLPQTGPTERNLGHGVLNLLEEDKIPAELRTSNMIRFQFGDLYWHPEGLSQSYLRAAGWEHATDVRRFALSHAIPLDRNEYGKIPGVRAGYHLAAPIRGAEQRISDVAAKAEAAGQSAGMPRVLREHEAMHDTMAQLEGNIASTAAHKEAINDLVGEFFPATTEGRKVEELIAAGYKQVPDHIYRIARKEIENSQTFLGKIYDNIMDVWKGAVLYARPAWLVNNILSQHFLYWLHHMGPSGIKAYLRAMQVKVDVGSHGQPVLINKAGEVVDQVKGLETLKSGGVNRALNEGLERRTILPEAGRRNPLTKAGGKAWLKKAPLIAPRAIIQPLRWANYRIADDQTRIASALASPELHALHAHLNDWTGVMGMVKRAISKHGLIPGSGRLTGEKFSIWDALARLPEKDAEAIVARTNKMLGDYRQMSVFERRTLTRIIPFWGWYRTIGVISLRLPIENPLRVLFIKNLEDAAKASGVGVPSFNTPSWLGGSIDRGPGPDGSENLVSTSGLNPFETDVQVAHAVGSTLSGDPQFGSQGPLAILTPAAAAVLQGMGYDPLYGGKYQGVGSGEGLPGRAVAGLFTGLPEYRLAEQTTGFGGYKSTLYKNSRWDFVANYLGYPIKRTDPQEAQRRAEEGQ